MWGQSWGQMIWGQARAVPALGFWVTILVGAVLGALGARRLRGGRPRVVATVALAIAILVPISARALPFVFSNGTVADATQVNANFAALASQQGLAPEGPSVIVDLVNSGSSCGPGVTLTNRVLPSSAMTFGFSAPPGQALIITDINIAIFLGTASAGHLINVQIDRTTVNASGVGPNQGAIVDVKEVTLDPHGAGVTTQSYGAGSAYEAGTAICVLAADSTTGAFVPFSASAHGFLTPQQ
jgi:hypothetical protein